MAHDQETGENILEKLLRTRYPLTNYLHRQQQFNKYFSSTAAMNSSNLSTSTNETSKPVSCQSKLKTAASMSAVSSFNVPDTLDPFSSEYDQMNHSDKMDDEISHTYDDSSIVKNNKHRQAEYNRRCSTSIQIEFSPMEHENNSPLRKAIEKALEIINR